MEVTVVNRNKITDLATASNGDPLGSHNADVVTPAAALTDYDVRISLAGLDQDGAIPDFRCEVKS